MRWRAAGTVVGAVVLVSSGCTAAADDRAVTTTSISIDATEAVIRDDSILRYGLSTTPTDPWVHYRTSCDTSCGIVFGAITDTLFATTTDGETVGLLVESSQANEDDTVHTWRLREGVSFSDGTPFDAAAVEVNIDACRHSPLTGPGLAGIDDIRAEGQTLTITTLAPWGNLAVHFAETPCGHMFSGAWLRSLPDLPMRLDGAPFADPVIAAVPPSGDPTAPIGLGAFVMTSFEPGNGNSTLLERNETYWRGPNGITGESLPLVDEIELVVIGDDATRQTALDSGQFDVIHSRGAAQQSGVEANGPSVSSAAFADVVHLAINTADRPDNPLAFVSCRRAIDRSIDRSTLGDEFGERPSTGPFLDLASEAAAGSEPSEAIDGDPLPVFDPVAATQWGERCVEDQEASITLRLLAPSGDARADDLAAMIERSIGALPAGGGVAIDVVALDPAALALAALLGDYDLLLWEGFAGVHPDLHFRWWYSEASAPIGSISTNIGRIEDPALDRALVALRRADSVDRSQRAIDDVGRAFAASTWTSWLGTVVWMVGSGDQVELELARSTPEGIELVPIVNGVHSLRRFGKR